MTSIGRWKSARQNPDEGAALQAYDALNFLGSIPWRANKQALAALSASAGC